ncbi:MAG: hypothetical protein ABIK56_02065 [candidate division WOR-3 bacterium]
MRKIILVIIFLGVIKGNSPPGKPVIFGPKVANMGEICNFKIFATDPDGDSIKYFYKENIITGGEAIWKEVWKETPFYASGETVYISYVLMGSGVREISFYTQDKKGATSEEIIYEITGKIPERLKGIKKFAGIFFPYEKGWEIIDFWMLDTSGRMIVRLQKPFYGRTLDAFWLCQLKEDILKKIQFLSIDSRSLIKEGGLCGYDKDISFNDSIFYYTIYGWWTSKWTYIFDLKNLERVGEIGRKYASRCFTPPPHFSVISEKEGENEVLGESLGKFLIIPYFPIKDLGERWRDITLGECCLEIDPKKNLGFLIKGSAENIPPFKVLVISDSELLIEIFKTDSFKKANDLKRSEYLEIWQRTKEGDDSYNFYRIRLGDIVRREEEMVSYNFYRWGIRLADGEIFILSDPIFFREKYSVEAAKKFNWILLEDIEGTGVFKAPDSVPKLPEVWISDNEERKRMHNSVMVKIKLPYKIVFYASSLSIAYYFPDKKGSLFSTSEIKFDEKYSMFSLSMVKSGYYTGELLDNRLVKVKIPQKFDPDKPIFDYP